MHPLTHPLPVTAHALLLDNGILTPARASVKLTAPPVPLIRTLKAFMRIARVKMPQS